MPRVTRRPLHAGSWYEDAPEVLREQIQGWLQTASPAAANGTLTPQPRAIIGPHAGYRYCGHVMAHAYQGVDATRLKRVFLLGPSHHLYTRRCALSPADAYSTPLGALEVDQQVYAQLRSSGVFDTMSLDADEAEHSLELHSPFIAALLAATPNVKLVPIMVGALSTAAEESYGRLLAPYLDDDSNLFVISSDFCHWGQRFSYTFYDKAQGTIWQSIRWLDEAGMAAIESGNPAQFAAYQAKYSNTICGRHPIGVLLNMVAHAQTRFSVRFKSYDQSSQCTSTSDSSVSYAAAVVTPVMN